MAKEKTQEQKLKYYEGMLVLLTEQIEGYKKLDGNTPREMHLAALGVLGIAESFAIVSFNTELLEEIAKVRSKIIASLRPKIKPTSDTKSFQIFYAKRPVEIPFLTPDFFLESDYHDLGDLEADRLEVVYGSPQ